MTTTRTTTNTFAGFPRERLLEWYGDHGRHDLPWRQTRDPYAVLVSEVMLQQTQVDRVVPYYHAWLERWPDAPALAGASPADVIRAWAGLGYNRRALNLHRSAVVVSEQFGGRVPLDEASLRTLPGVGPYTAAAVASFAGECPVAVTDTNIGRVLARLCAGVAGALSLPPKRVDEIARSVLPASGVRDHNLALMDLGAIVCSARSPRCEDCPVEAHCAWKAAGCPAADAATVPAPRFETTARFARGRLIHALRECSPRSEAALAAVLPSEHAPRTDIYLTTLERDGLVERYDDGWALAGETPGSKSIASPKL